MAAPTQPTAATATPDSATHGSVGTGTSLAVAAVASVQFGATIAEHLFARVGPLGTVSLRLTGAAILLVAFARPWRRHWARADLGAAAVFGLVFTGMNTALYLAIDRLPIATAVTLEFLGPLAVSIATATSWAVRAWALPAATGVALLGGALHGGDLLGVAFALAAACCWAGYILVSGRMGRTGTGLPGLSMAIALAAVITLPIGFVSAGSDLLRPSTIGIGFAVGLLSSAVPYSLDLLALRRLPTAVFGVLTSLNPGMAALAGLLVLDQTLGGRSIGGIALVTAASVGVTVTPALRRAGRGRSQTSPALDEPITAA